MWRDRAAAALWSCCVWTLMVFFLANLLALIAVVLLNSFSSYWFDTWLPTGISMRWYGEAWHDFALGQVLLITAEVVGAVVIVSGLIGVPVAYAMARRNFPS